MNRDESDKYKLFYRGWQQRRIEKIEKIFENNGFSFVRYDDSDLNDGIHCYDWKVENTAHHGIYTRSRGVGKRRFWVAKKK